MYLVYQYIMKQDWAKNFSFEKFFYWENSTHKISYKYQYLCEKCTLNFFEFWFSNQFVFMVGKHLNNINSVVKLNLYEMYKDFRKTHKNIDKYQFSNYVFYILSQMKPLKNGGIGIYGIYEDNQLVYIGYTMRSFDIRWQEHRRGIAQQSDKLWLYKLINKKNKIDFRVLLDVTELKYNRKITKHDLEMMELALIHVFKPKYNFAGKTIEYNKC